jgi:hypothetical protein
MDFGPDLYFAANDAFNADPGYKLGMGVESLIPGLGMSLLGRGVGRFAGRRLMGLEGEALQTATNVGSMALSIPASMYGPRPVMESMFRAREKRQQPGGQSSANAEQPLAPIDSVTGLPAETQSEIMRNQLINSILMGTGTAYGALDAQRAGAALT